MTRGEVIEVLEKHLKCMETNNKHCLWDSTHSCEACEFFTTDEDWIQAESYAVDELKERKTGKWKHVHQWTWDCSECGYRVNAKYFRYCPMCGAKMEGAEE